MRPLAMPDMDKTGLGLDTQDAFPRPLAALVIARLINYLSLPIFPGIGTGIGDI